MLRGLLLPAARRAMRFHRRRSAAALRSTSDERRAEATVGPHCAPTLSFPQFVACRAVDSVAPDRAAGGAQADREGEQRLKLFEMTCA